MAGEIHASFSGMATYADLCRDQQGFLQEISGLVDCGLADFGAFTGFMSFFADAYRSAHETVSEEIRRSVTGAGDMGTNIDAVLADFRRTDDGVKNDLGKLDVRVECATFEPLPGHEGFPGVPAPVKTANAGLGVLDNAENMAPHLPQHLVDGLPGRTPPLDDAGIRGLPTDGVELVNQVADTMAAGQSIGQAQDDEDLYEEFEGRHRSKEEPVS